MRDLRPAIGVALLVSIALVFVTGLIVETTREVYLIFGGFVGGLVTACLVDSARIFLARRRPEAAWNAITHKAPECTASALDLASGTELEPGRAFPRPWDVDRTDKAYAPDPRREVPGQAP